MAHWNWLDWVFVIIVLASIVTAIWKGFVAELLSLASVIAGLIVAAAYYERVAPLLVGFTRSHDVALGVSFIVLFAVVVVIGALVSAVAGRLIRKVKLQWFDRFLGAVFGLMRGLLVDCILLLVMMTFAIERSAVRKSILAPYVTVGSRIIALAMPSHMRSDFRTGLRKFKRALIHTDKKAMEVQSTSREKL